MRKSIAQAVRRQNDKAQISAAYAAIKAPSPRKGIKFEDLTRDEQIFFCKIPMNKEERKKWQKIANKLER